MTIRRRLSLLGLFLQVRRLHPHNIAVQDGDQSLSYSALDARSSELARQLQKAGARSDQVIPIITNSCLHMVVGVLAILKAGATYVPIDRDQWPRERIENVLAQVSAELVVYTGRDLDLSANVAAAINADQEYAGLEPQCGLALAERSADLAAIIFTSGTTGKPKGVMVREESLARFVSTPKFNYDVAPGDRVLLVLSVAFDACMGTLFNTICNGGTVVLANRSNIQQRACQCSVLVATPSILEALEPPSSQSDYALLDRIVLGGETASCKLLETWTVLQRSIWIAYGPTEATCATLTGLVQTCPHSGEFRPTILGSIIDGAEVTIVDQDGNDIDALDQEGELLISGSGLAAGYWNDECRTNEKFVIRNGKRSYRTGDLAKWTAVGEGQKAVDFCGRADRTVKIRGFLVNLDLDVDAGIMALERSLKAVHSVRIGRKLCTAVSPPPRDAEDLRSRWRAAAPAYLVPDFILGLDALPTTPNGKLDPRRLRDLLHDSMPKANGAAEPDLEPTSLKDVVLGGVSQILDVPAASIDIAQPFVSQGVHSLAAAMLASHCRKHGFSVSVLDMLTAPSIRAVLESAQATQPVRAERYNACQSDREGPLTTLQKMLIYGSAQDAAANVVQHISAYRSEDIARLRAAWQAVAAAEPLFRTHFDMDTLTQRVLDAAPFRWQEHAVRSQREVEARTAEAARAAGLGSGFAVLHCRGAELPRGESFVVWSTHHALIDGFSAVLLLNKAAAALAGRAVTPSPPFSVAAAALRRAAERVALEADVFWRQQERAFPGAAGDVLLPRPPAPPAGTGHAEHARQTGVDAAVLGRAAQAAGATPAAVHYAAWALTLASYASADTVVFGAVLSARSLACDGAESVVGPLISTQPLHVRIDRGAGAAAMVRDVHRTIQTLARLQAAERTGEPLHFASAIAIQYDAPALAEAAVQPLRPPAVRESTDIPLTVLVEGDGRVRFLYRRDLFAADHVAHMAAVYANVLRGLTQREATVRQCLSARLGPQVSDMLLAVGNHASPMTYVAERSRSLATAIEAAARANAGCVAVEKGVATLTYAELMAAADRVAAAAEKITQPGDVVCVVADRSINWIVGAVAVFKAGGCYCPLDAAHSVEYRAELLRMSGATLLLCPDSARLREPMPGGPVALAVDQILASGVEPKRTPPRLQSSLAPAYMCFTSGSTGKPKGVVCNHGGLTALHSEPECRLHAAPGVRIAQFLATGFDCCVQEVTAALSHGATLVLRKDPDDPFSHLGDVDVALVTPSVAAELDPAEYGNIKYFYMLGEPLQQATLDKWARGRTAYNLYGPTEGTVGNTLKQLTPGVPVSVGRPMPGTRVYVLDDHLALQPPGVVGNVFIAGAQVSRGYVNMPDATAREFVPDPFCPDAPAERMYRTGDLGFWGQGGDLHVCGRRDRQVKMRGFRINLDDVAAVALREAPAVRKAFATQHRGRLMLWVEPARVDTDELARRLRAALPAHAQPKAITALARLPVSANGKLDATALAAAHAQAHARARTGAGAGAGAGAAPWAPTRFEALVAQEWRLLLDLGPDAPVAPDDHFTALGGHSVLQLSLAARLRRVCRVPVGVRDVIHAPSLQELARLVQARCEQQQQQQQTPPQQPQQPLGEAGALSPPEREWWLRYQHAAATARGAFNVPFVAALAPSVDGRRLAAALAAALNRHRVLRSRFVQPAGGPVRRELAAESVAVPVVDSIDAAAFVNEPFDLARGPLVRAAVSLSPALLAVSVAHIVCDLTALDTLLAETAALYNGGTLEPLRREYFDVTAWAQPPPDEPESASWWAASLHGLRLHRQDNALPPRSGRGTSLVQVLPAGLHAAIAALTAGSGSGSALHGLTLHQFGLAASGAVLHALCRRSDVVLGAPYHSRTAADDANLVGLFLQALPVRVRPPARETAAAAAPPSSADVLRAVQRASQGSLAHALPWPRLLDRLGLPFESARRQQLFDCVVTFHDDRNGAAAPLAVPGARPLHVWAEGAKFALLFEWHAFPDRLSVRLEYDSDALPEALVRIVQVLVQRAAEALVDLECGYEALLGDLRRLLERECVERGLEVEEMHELAVKFLRGV
ncbi:NRPS [Neofusicoccum ribis]|uniref:NRPS n=1 Tax=Neofusicoccum ribis TaxID=45134 RepID=A0ABR3SJF1_9PEZI